MFRKVLFLMMAVFMGVGLCASSFAQSSNEPVSPELAFEQAKKQALPMTPEQIKEFLGEFRKSQRASVEGQKVNPRKRMRVVSLPVDPGKEIPTVYAAQGYVTAISFLDATGYGWPIIDVVSGGNFTITPPETNGHILRVSPNVRFGYGNLSVRLKGLSFPVTINVEVGDELVDYRFDARVPLKGPNSRISISQISDIKSAGDATLSAILEGIIPDGTVKLKVSEGEIDGTSVYQKGDQLFIRTRSTLLSPRWESSASVSEGVKVYTIKSSPVLLFSDSGEVIKQKVQLLKKEK